VAETDITLTISVDFDYLPKISEQLHLTLVERLESRDKIHLAQVSE
jgi:hypothetical protein